MPYKSEAQRKFMHAKHPEIAKKWDKKYEEKKNLPDYVNPPEPEIVRGKRKMPKGK